MPAHAPPISEDHAATLAAWGRCIREARRRHGISAVAAAEAAGMSRATFHRVERGEPSVTIGAYLSAIAVVGLVIDVLVPGGSTAAAERADGGVTPAGVPNRIRLVDYPQLARLAWQRSGAAEVTPAEALALYERNWRHVDEAAMAPAERALVRALAGGRLLV